MGSIEKKRQLFIIDEFKKYNNFDYELEMQRKVDFRELVIKKGPVRRLAYYGFDLDCLAVFSRFFSSNK